MGDFAGIDLFAGAGGLSLGASLAGVDVVCAVESSPRAVATYSHNFPDVHVVQSDIRSVDADTLCCQGRPLVIFGGPPCQGFSVSNQRTRNRSNPTNWLFKEFIRIVAEVLPAWVVIENVDGIRQTDNGRFVSLIHGELRRVGYSATAWTLDATDFGVPQRRARWFVVGSRRGLLLQKPQPTAVNKTTVGEAIRDLPALANGASESWMPYGPNPPSHYGVRLRNPGGQCPNNLVTRNETHIVARYSHIPQGGNWKSIPADLMSNYKDRSRCHTGIYRRLSDDQPSVVIGNFRKNMLIHPTQNRGLSVREAARLQSFPDHFEFVGSIGFQQQQAGNAVPPLLAEGVFRAIIDAEARAR